MKFMLMMNAPKGEGDWQVTSWPTEDLKAHIDFMIRFAEAKEFLAGYWIVEVDSLERAYEIAARASAAPGRGGAPINMPIEVRQVMSAPPR